MAYHSRLWSPSSAHRWVNCPGAYRFKEILNAQKCKFPRIDWTAAQEGTLAHEAAECAIAGKSVDHYPQEMLEHIKEYVDAILIQSDAMIEVRVDFSEWLQKDDAKGTADCILINENVLEVRDFKYGFSFVSAFENEQLMLYALGAISTLDLKERFLSGELNEIRLSVWQPRRNNYSTWSTDLLTLVEFGEKAKRASDQVIACQDLNYYEEIEPYLDAGTAQCSYCECAPLCPKVYAKIKTIKDQFNENT